MTSCSSWASHGYPRPIAHGPSQAMDDRGQPLGWQRHGHLLRRRILAALFRNNLDLKDAVLVGHSTGRGRGDPLQSGRHGTSRLAKAVLVDAISPAHAEDGSQSGWPANRSVRPTPRRPSIADRFAVLQRISGAPFLRCQQGRAPRFSQGIRGHVSGCGSMQVGLKRRIRLHQGLLRDGPHGRTFKKFGHSQP